MRDENDTHKILILGGGYAGVMAASRLAINGVRAEITLVDARAELVQRIRLHETLAGSTPRTLPYRLLELKINLSRITTWLFRQIGQYGLGQGMTHILEKVAEVRAN